MGLCRWWCVLVGLLCHLALIPLSGAATRLAGLLPPPGSPLGGMDAGLLRVDVTHHAVLAASPLWCRHAQLLFPYSWASGEVICAVLPDT